ncbi:hypothetical protein H9P43_005938 [Blastocladiella emersonii ATCC 22665]|nr:hypothetical protein H9P43_005938 [Blastocladiella emersonii ATCC 22665]
MKRAVNPVNAYNREQRKKELLKNKQQRDDKKRAAEDAARKLQVDQAELARLTEIEAQRQLTPAERARKRELRATTGASSSSSSSSRTPASIPSAMFDPLAESHASHSAVNRRNAPIAGLASYQSDSDLDELLASDLDDDFMPPLPPLDDPRPPSYRPPPGTPAIATMGGYPPPPPGPVPRHPPQMDPPAIAPPGTVPPPPRAGAASLPVRPGGPVKPAPVPVAAPVLAVSAAPQLRDLQKEMSALAPSPIAAGTAPKQRKVIKSTADPKQAPKETDAAYQDFLKEMEGLL